MHKNKKNPKFDNYTPLGTYKAFAFKGTQWKNFLPFLTTQLSISLFFSPSTFNAEKKNGMGQKEEEKGKDGFSEIFPLSRSSKKG